MKTNFSMLFYLKKQKNYTSGLAPIYLRITVNGQRAELTANRECEPEKWNSHSGRAIGTKENIKGLNAFLDNLQAEAYEVHRYLYENDKEITAEAIKNKMLSKSETSYTLIEIFKEHNRKVESLVGQEFAPATCKRYQTSLQHTQAFLKHKFGINDIDIKKIDNAFVSEYDFYLRSIRKCNNNTTLMYIQYSGKNLSSKPAEVQALVIDAFYFSATHV